MPKTQKSTALYPHPFSKAYWRDAAAELKSVKTLVVAAMMIALRVATKGLAVPIAPDLDLFSVASFINALSAMIIGPVVAIPAAFISDFLGVLLWDGLGTYFLPYALQEIGSSLIWALLLYRAKPTTLRVMIGRLSICLVINVLLGTAINMWWQTIYYGQSSMVLTLPRVLKNTFMFPIEAVVMTFFLSLMVPITNRMGLTYSGTDVKEKLTFGKKQIIVLAALFVVGVTCVVSYLFYYYDNTSLSASYSTQERIDTNKQMQQIVLDETDTWDDAANLTITDSAYKKFLGNEITYTVSIYIPAEGAEISEEMWKLKKSAAAKHEDLVKNAVATIVVEEKTGKVLSFNINYTM